MRFTGGCKSRCSLRVNVRPFYFFSCQLGKCDSWNVINFTVGKKIKKPRHNSTHLCLHPSASTNTPASPSLPQPGRLTQTHTLRNIRGSIIVPVWRPSMERCGLRWKRENKTADSVILCDFSTAAKCRQIQLQSHWRANGGIIKRDVRYEH